jgi:hypothetical protein
MRRKEMVNFRKIQENPEKIAPFCRNILQGSRIINKKDFWAIFFVYLIQLPAFLYSLSKGSFQFLQALIL